MPTRYREITVAGSPRDMGRQIGEAARDEIRGFCEVALQRVNKTVRVSHKTAYSIAERSLPFAEEYAPHLVEELRGTAEAAGVSLIDLMLLQVRNQLKPEADAGCTSLSIANSETNNPIVAQNWDNDPLLDDFTVVLTRRPVNQPATICVTQAGLIAYIGFSDTGIAACLNTLPAPSRDVGVPHYFTLRGLYEAKSLDGCVRAVNRAHRAIPANIMLGTPQGPANLEVTIDRVDVLRPENVADAASVGTDAGSVRHDRITHTNHCLHPELCAINDEFPELIQSYPRKDRIDVLLAECPGVVTVDNVERLLRDHAGNPRSICRHPNDDSDTGFWQTVFSVVIEPVQRRMHITRGTPCDHPFETYCLQG
jgi:isopenicillin-N N-acyltransferase like protein